jgi:hypothetical protein
MGGTGLEPVTPSLSILRLGLVRAREALSMRFGTLLTSPGKPVLSRRRLRRLRRRMPSR